MVQFSQAIQEKLYAALRGSFPDAKISNEDTLALAICLQREKEAGGDSLPQELKDIDLTQYSSELRARAGKYPQEIQYPLAREPGDESRYYWVTASHDRTSPAGFKPFTGELTMARVTLTERTPKVFKTAFGTINPSDHLIDTVYEANQKYERTLGYHLERVDLITPARDGLRFGAISVLFGYKKASDKKPSCYILEAGTATGQPKVLYLGKQIGGPINRYSGYSPTPFACPNHAYYGVLTTQNNDDPDTLTISSRAVENGVSQPPYIKVVIKWELQTGGLKTIWPGFLITRAAAIVLGRQITGKISTDCNDGPPLP